MKLNAIEIRNFGPYRSADIPLAPGVNLLAGANGTGKSTVIRALSAALTGTCEGFEQGKNAGDLRRVGSGRKWGVTLKTDGTSIVRKEGEGPRAKIQAAIDEQLGVEPARVRAVLHASELPRLNREKPKAARELLLSLSAPAIPVPDSLRAELGDDLAAEVERLSIADLERLHRIYYDRRREVGQKRDGAKVARPVPPADELAGMDLAAVRAHLEQMNERRDARIREAATKRQTAKSLRAQVADRQRKTDRRTALARERDAITEVTEEQLRTAFDLAARREEEMNEALPAKRKALTAAGEAERARDEARARLAAFDKQGGTCAACTQPITDEVRATVRTVLEQTVEAAVAHVETTAKARGEAIRTATAATEARDQAKAEDDRLRRDAEKRRQLSEKIRELDEALADSVADGNPDELDAEAARLEESAAADAELREDITSYEGALRAHEDSGRKVDDLQAEYERLDRVVAALGPDGIRCTEAGQVADFSADLSKHLEPFGFEVELAEMMATGAPALVNGRRLELLSKSEEVRFGVAFAIAVAEWSNLGIVAVDNFETLDAANRQAVLELLLGCGLQSIICSVATTDEQYLAAVAALEPAGVACLHVVWGEDGSTVRRVGAGRAAA